MKENNVDKIVDTGERQSANDRIVHRTAASIDPPLASRTISIEVIEAPGGTRGLEPIVHAGDPLPKKGVVAFRASTVVAAGSRTTLHFKLCEGDLPGPLEDNMPIGTFCVSGAHFDVGTISIGSKIRCQYEITNDGMIRLDVSIPEIGGSFASGHQYYTRQVAQLDYARSLDMVAAEAQLEISRLDELLKYVDDPRVETVMERIKKASSLDLSRALTGAAEHALHEIRAARRDISTIRRHHQTVIRQLDLDIIVMSFDEWARQFAQSEEALTFDDLAQTAQRFIDSNADDFDSELEALRSISFAVLSRSDEFVVERFHWLAHIPEQFTNKPRYAVLTQQGREALARSDTASLRVVLNQLEDLRSAGGFEAELAVPNILRG